MITIDDLDHEQICREVALLVAEVAPHSHIFRPAPDNGRAAVFTGADPCGLNRRTGDDTYALCDACAEAILKACKLSPSMKRHVRNEERWLARRTGRAT